MILIIPLKGFFTLLLFFLKFLSAIFFLLMAGNEQTTQKCSCEESYTQNILIDSFTSIRR